MSHSYAPSPGLFFETVNSYQRTSMLKTAIELGVFTAVADGHHTAQAIAEMCKASERGIRILCDGLVVLGFLTKENGTYAATQDTATFLSQRSPAYLGGTLEFLLNPTSLKAFENLTEAVRRGGTAIPEEGALEHDHPMWVRFARGMAPLMRPAAEFMAGLAANNGFPPQFKALDIAAGHGIFGVAVAEQCPGADVVALDWPHVLEVAQENAAHANVSARHRLLPGNAFEVDFGSGYHLVLLTNFLHHFDEATCEELLKKIHRALAPGGAVFTLEFVPNADRVSPPNAAAFSLTMLASTPSGDAYTLEELERMLTRAGFSQNTAHPLPGGMQTVIESKV